MQQQILFQDRSDAGKQLASRLESYANRSDVTVLGLPRGGVPVAYEVADALNVPLDVYVVRKLGVPGHEEMAMGAIASNGVRYLNSQLIDQLDISATAIDQITQAERQELKRREVAYRGKRSPANYNNRTILLVDDGLATGATMTAAVKSLRQQSPQSIVVAVPVAAPETCAMFEKQVDQVVCAETPQPFRAVGLWYETFNQTTDSEVCALLHRAQTDKQTTA